MSPGLTVVVVLAALYILGREYDRYGRNTAMVLTPSRCEHLDTWADDDAEGMDTFAEIWNAAYAEDELERLWELPARSHA